MVAPGLTRANNNKQERVMARVAIVTGGTRGIGEAISVALSDMGMKVAANYAGNDERARAFSDRTGIQTFRWDVADFDACQQGVAQVEAALGPVDVLVNNAGITRDSTMKRIDHQKWQEVIDTNLGGCFNMAKAVFEGMQSRGYGRIVNIGSINGQAGQYGQVNYAAAKSGIHGFTKALAQEGARNNVTVNAIAPGYIDTDMVAAVPEPCLRKCWPRSSPRSPSTGSARRRKSPAGLPSWSTKMPASSPDRRCRSTAASICIDGTGVADKTVGDHRRP
jgi:acetoacetyl-CoA reductase